MKKIIATAVGLAMVGGVAVTTASAVESQFGGFWRTRLFFENNFHQLDNTETTTPTLKVPVAGAPGYTVTATGTPVDNPAYRQPKDGTWQNSVDTRTRLYYTAKFNDDFKFVNKFEFNTAWGDNNGGDIGADGKGNFRIKNSYVDFNLGSVNTKVGIQPATIARGFIFSDDFSGVVATADFGAVKLPVLYGWLSNNDANTLGWDGSKAASVPFITQDDNITASLGGGTGDVHMFSVMPTFKVNDNVALTPHATWVNANQADVYYLGLDADLKFDAVTAWFTGIYNGGKIDKEVLDTTQDADISAYLLAAGADAGIVHGQAFYASGDDSKNNDIDSYVAIGAKNATGTSYYWSEIMGCGIFDYETPDGGLGEKISNIWAVNVGVSLKPMDKLNLGFDVWYAQNAEDVSRPTVANPNNTTKDLGTELDAKLSYELMDNLNADVVFAYLFAGDAFGPDDVVLTGLQLSLKF